jgi:DNA anti-recombination protein RmuC
VGDPVETRRERVRHEANADGWTQWGQDIAGRVVDLEIKTTAWLGVDSKISDDDPPIVIALIEDSARDERKERAGAIAKLAEAWTERLAAEIAVLDDRLSKKLDSRIFDLDAVKAFKADLEKGVRAEMQRSRAETHERLAEMASKLAGMEAQLRKRDQVRRALLERLAREHSEKLALGKTLGAKVDELAAESRSLRADFEALVSALEEQKLVRSSEPALLPAPV